mgnify:CR=1 FL=1
MTDIKIEHFYSNIKKDGISEKDFKHVQEVIKVFGIKTLREYHDLYLYIDVKGLRDVFESYRKLSMDIYSLDPCYFFGAPSLSWNAGLLKCTISEKDFENEVKNNENKIY